MKYKAKKYIFFGGSSRKNLSNFRLAKTRDKKPIGIANKVEKDQSRLEVERSSPYVLLFIPK